MNLTACDTCGVVYDKDCIQWPDRCDCYDENGNYADDATAYVDGEFYKKVECRICGADIVDYSEQLWG